MKTGESRALANDITASILESGQHRAKPLRRKEEERLRVDASEHGSVERHVHLRGLPGATGDDSIPTDRVSAHAGDAQQSSRHNAIADVSRTSHSSTPPDGVADITTSVCARGEVLRSQPLPMALSLFGIFPNLPAPRCALIEPWAPRKFPREPATPITDEDIVDVTFGLLVGVRREGTSKRNGKTYRCLCRCGAECVKEATKLLQGTVRACRYNCPRIDELVLPWKGNPTSARSQQKVIANRKRLAKFREAKQAMPESEPWRKAGMSRSAWYRAGRPGK